jgi:hypothetical protein
MDSFEYRITTHPAEEFMKVSFFCSETGECSLDDVPGGEMRHVEDILTREGGQGWELVQLSFGRAGLMAFWKRKLA